jgi:hypothetical protein
MFSHLIGTDLTAPSTTNPREYWRAHGVTWRDLFELHAAIVNRLQANSSLWCSSC